MTDIISQTYEGRLIEAATSAFGEGGPQGILAVTDFVVEYCTPCDVSLIEKTLGIDLPVVTLDQNEVTYSYKYYFLKFESENNNAPNANDNLPEI